MLGISITYIIFNSDAEFIAEFKNIHGVLFQKQITFILMYSLRQFSSEIKILSEWSKIYIFANFKVNKQIISKNINYIGRKTKALFIWKFSFSYTIIIDSNRVFRVST